MNKEPLIRIAGLAGILLAAAGLVVFAINSQLTGTAGALLITGAVLCLAYLVLGFDDVKNFLTARGTRYKGGTAVLIGIVVLILALVNFIGNRHTRRFDLTGAGLYSLSSQTVKLLEGLDRDIRVLAFATGGRKTVVKDLMQEYLYHSRRITVGYYDLNEEPALAKKYGVDREGTLVIEAGGRIEKFDDEPTEERVTNALLKVTREGRKTVYFVEGHEEKDIDNTDETGYSQLKTALEKDRYVVKKVLLLRAGRVPDDCDVLVIPGPKKDLLQVEKEAVAVFLDRNGKALILLDPEEPALTDLLQPWRVLVGDDILVDINPAGKYYGATEFMPVTIKYLPHAITAGFKAATIFPLARSVRADPAEAEGVKAEELVRTSEQSWAETNLKAKGVEYNEGRDRKGPVPLAVAVISKEKDRKDPDEIAGADSGRAGGKGTAQTRLVVAGDSDFAINAYLPFSGNRDLVLNMISWLAEEEDMISIRPKEKRDQRVYLTLRQSRIIFWLSVVIAPLLVLCAGIWVWIRRRRTT